MILNLKTKRFMFFHLASIDTQTDITIADNHAQSFSIFQSKVIPLFLLWSTLCFFYKKSFYKSHEPENHQKIRITHKESYQAQDHQFYENQ